MATKTTQSNAVNTSVVIASLEKKGDPIAKGLNILTAIKTQKEFDTAAEQVALLKDLGSQAEEKEAAIIDPIKQSIKETQSLFAPFKKLVKDTEAHVKSLMSAFLTKQDEKQKKIEDDFESGKIKKVATYARKVAETQVKSVIATVKKRKVMVITDANKIPREYLVPDTKAITEALKKGVKVPGCEMQAVKSIAI